MKIEFKCSNCGKEYSITKRRFDGRLLCRQCKAKDTSMKKYGVDNPAKAEKVRQKMSESIKKSTLEAAEKRRKTSLERYGTLNPGQSAEAKQKRLKSLEKKYGENPYSYLNSKEIQQKRHTTCIERYGAKTPFESKEIQQNNLNKHKWTSDDNPMSDSKSIKKER